MKPTDCLVCASDRQQLVLPLGRQPLANSYLTEAQLTQEEPRFPLDLYVCEECMAAHIEVVATGEDIFSDYAYFSSYSTTWLEHARRYVDMITQRLGLGGDAFVLEIASNDGYLLQWFVERGVPCMGIEPAGNIAAAAREKGIPTEVAFWGKEKAEALKERQGGADLILGNNVLAHTPNPNDLVAGIKAFLKPSGVVTMEFPHLLRLMEEGQFDTIYHEHFSYFSFSVARKLFARHGLTLFDVEVLPTHGGSLRIHGRHDENGMLAIQPAVAEMLERERDTGLEDLAYYQQFGARVARVREDVTRFFADAAAQGKRVVGYGAPAKGNTLLNYCEATPEWMPYTLDRNPHKQGQYLPGTHIPIRAPECIVEDKPDYLFILPWNLREEIMEQMQHIREWGGKFVTPIPTLAVHD